MTDIIISDTSCFIILTNIGHLDLLQLVYGNVITTPEVAEEYSLKLPEWVHIVSPANRSMQNILEKYVDKGEASAIALGTEIEGCTIILDDYSARKMAEKLNLAITGTLGVIIKAKNDGIIISIKPFIERLKATNFRLSPSLYAEALKESGENE